MPEKFQNKYEAKSARLHDYDYSQNGLYFVTICTQDRECFFGGVKNGEMILSEIGKIANQFWQEIPAHFSFVNLDEFVVMPNHVHGVLEIWKNPVETQFIASKTNITSKIINVFEPNIAYGTQNAIICKDGISYQDAITCQDALKCVSTENAENNKKPGGVTGLKNPSLNPGSLSNIIKWYKGRCAFEIGKLFPIGFHWQPKFYDHIIRNDKALNKIREYIITNPERWERDRNLPDDGWGILENSGL